MSTIDKIKNNEIKNISYYLYYIIKNLTVANFLVQLVIIIKITQ